jgi:lipoate-protein ligase A
VWHAHEVTYAVAGPVGLFGSLAATYRAIHEVLAAALRHLGLDATLADAAARAPGPGAGPCFAAPVGGEVLVGGRKVIGSAQLRDGHRFLQHGSILLADGQDLIGRVSRRPAAAPAAAGLGALLGRDITFAETADAVAAAAERAWPGRWDGEEAPHPAPDDSNPFADPEWTWRR